MHSTRRVAAGVRTYRTPKHFRNAGEAHNFGAPTHNATRQTNKQPQPDQYVYFPLPYFPTIHAVINRHARTHGRTLRCEGIYIRFPKTGSTQHRQKISPRKRIYLRNATTPRVLQTGQASCIQNEPRDSVYFTYPDAAYDQSKWALERNLS